MQQQTANLSHFILGNTRPVRKFPELISAGVVRHHRAVQGRTVNNHFNLGSMRRLREAFRRNDQEIAVDFVQNPLLGPTCVADVGRIPPSTVVSVTKLHTHSLNAGFYYIYYDR
jgi:hypothetical protein